MINFQTKELIFPLNFESFIKDSYIILDTNIFINLAINNKIYLDFIIFLKNNNVDLITFDLCYWEFLKGSVNENEIGKKNKIFKELEIGVLPSRNLIDTYLETIRLYRRKGREVSLVDLFLAAGLIKYSKGNQKIYLLTGNYKDFYFNIFIREKIVLVNTSEQITPLVFLSINKESYKKSLNNF